MMTSGLFLVNLCHMLHPPSCVIALTSGQGEFQTQLVIFLQAAEIRVAFVF